MLVFQSPFMKGTNAATKALKLPILLEGKAVAIWLELSTEQRPDYAVVKEQLIMEIVPIDFVTLEFHSHKM